MQPNPSSQAKQLSGAVSCVELMPGDLAMGFAGDQFKTLLGSCVSVILTDPRRTVGAMCHIVHAGVPNASNANNTAYAQAAMYAMFERLRSVGADPTQCEAYIFGGGNMFPEFAVKRHVGDNNVDWVIDFLDAHGIHIVDHCLGGNGYRKVFWTVGPLPPQVETVLPE